MNRAANFGVNFVKRCLLMIESWLVRSNQPNVVMVSPHLTVDSLLMDTVEFRALNLYSLELVPTESSSMKT